MNTHPIEHMQRLKPRNLGFTEHVVPQLAEWRSSGVPAALVTLVGIDGNSPRPIGSQIAVNMHGDYVGQITAGCAEAAIAAEAVKCLINSGNKLVRYGKGSPYIDVTLPCGSGLDIYFDSLISDEIIFRLAKHHHDREPVTLGFDLKYHAHKMFAPTDMTATLDSEKLFLRSFQPTLRLAIAGSGPAVTALAITGRTLGWDITVFTPDDETRISVKPHAGSVYGIRESLAGLVDPWTACITLFHDHDLELPLLKSMLDSDCFFIGALGSLRTHAARVAALEAQGVPDHIIARIHGPAGLDIGSKSPSEIAISITAQIIQFYRKGNA